MSFRSPVLLIGGIFSAVLIIGGVIWFLRSRNIDQEATILTTATTSRVNASKKDEEYTPAELKERDTLNGLIQNMPASISDTWPPGFRVRPENK